MKARQLARLNLQRRPLPTWIAIISIALSVACSGILLRLAHLSASRFASMGRGWEAVVGAKAGGIEILLNSLNAEGPNPDFLPQALFESLRAMQTVQFEDGQKVAPKFLRSVTPFLYFAKWKDVRVLGTDETFAQALGASPCAEGSWSTAPGQIVLGSQVAAYAGAKVGDTFTVHPWIGARVDAADLNLQVVGVLRATDSAWDRMAYATLAQAQAVLARHEDELQARSIWKDHVLSFFLVNLQPGGFTQLEALINKRTVGQAILVENEKMRLEELTGSGRSLGFFVSILVIVLSSLSVASMLVTRFEGMSAQLAVLRAIGYSRGEIGRWLMWEGLLLGVAGCVLGALLDGVGFPFVRELLGSSLPPVDVVQSSVCESYWVWLLALVATCLAIFFPLIRLYRQDVHQALKS